METQVAAATMVFMQNHVARKIAREKARINARNTGVGGQGYRRMNHGKRGPQGKDRR